MLSLDVLSASGGFLGNVWTRALITVNYVGGPVLSQTVLSPGATPDPRHAELETLKPPDDPRGWEPLGSFPVRLCSLGVSLATVAVRERGLLVWGNSLPSSRWPSSFPNVRELCALSSVPVVILSPSQPLVVSLSSPVLGTLLCKERGSVTDRRRSACREVM